MDKKFDELWRIEAERRRKAGEREWFIEVIDLRNADSKVLELCKEDVTQFAVTGKEADTGSQSTGFPFFFRLSVVSECVALIVYYHVAAILARPKFIRSGTAQRINLRDIHNRRPSTISSGAS
jgi:hypothetical protein